MTRCAFVLIALSLLSCSVYPSDSIPYTEAQALDDNIPTYFTTPTSVIRWAAGYVDYVSDSEQFGIGDYWQTPEEVLKNKKGDCEDLAILFMYACDLRLGIRPTMDIYYLDTATGRKWHAVGQWNGDVYDASLYKGAMSNWVFYYRYSYRSAMDEAEYMRSVR